MMKQTFVRQKRYDPKFCFGGSLLKNSNAKTKRPLDVKLPHHVVFRARRGGMRVPRVFGKVHQIIRRAAKRHGVKIHKEANVGNHVHLVASFRERRAWAGFAREIAGSISLALRCAGILKGRESYWQYRPFTRIVKNWGRAFRIAVDYVELNIFEAEGLFVRSKVQSNTC